LNAERYQDQVLKRALYDYWVEKSEEKGWFFFSRTEEDLTLQRVRKPGWLEIQLSSFLIQPPFSTLVLSSHSVRGSKPLSKTTPNYQPALVNLRQLFMKFGTEYLWRISHPILNT
jgi:hypothetical protein